MRANKLQEYKEAIKLYKQGQTRKYIADKLNVTEKTVGNWVREYNRRQTSLQSQINELRKELETIKRKLNDAHIFSV